MKRFGFVFVIFVSVVSKIHSGPNDSDWIQLLRAGDTQLSDWIPKIAGQAAGSDPRHSFRYATAKDGSPRLEVTDTLDHTSSFGMGHLFYKTPFSDYILRAQFHFPTKTTHAGSSWTIQNNGLMLHCQSPASMGTGQAYPNSIEDQLLGYWSTAIAKPPKSTSSNVCVPGVTIKYNGLWYSDQSGHHCTEARYHDLTYDSMTTAVPGANSVNSAWPGAAVWQYAMARVIDSASMTFWVRSRPDTAWDSVMHFTSIHLGGAPSTTNLGSATPLTQGYISIQMEGTSTEFAKIELLNLVGCMNPSDVAYRAYFVKSDPSKCGGATAIAAPRSGARAIVSLLGNRVTATEPIAGVEVFDARGARVASLPGAGRTSVDIEGLRQGLYTLRVKTAMGSARMFYTRLK